MNRQKFTAIVSTVLLLLALIMSIAALRTPLVSLRVTATDASTGDVRRFDEGIYFFSSGGAEKIFFECEVLKKRLLGSAITGLLTSIALASCFVFPLVKLVELYSDEEHKKRRQQQQQQQATTSYRKDSKEEEADDDTGAHSVAISSHKDSANATAVDRQPPQQQNQQDDGFTSRSFYFALALTFTFLASVTATLYAWRCLDTECSATFPLYFGLASFSDTASIGPTLGKTDIAVLGPAAPMTSISFAIIIVVIVLQVVTASFDSACCACCSVDTCCANRAHCCRECWRDEKEEDEADELEQQQQQHTVGQSNDQQQQQQSRLFQENEAAIRALNQRHLELAAVRAAMTSGALPGSYMSECDSMESDDMSREVSNGSLGGGGGDRNDDDDYHFNDDDDAGSVHGARSPVVEFISISPNNSPNNNSPNNNSGNIGRFLLDQQQQQQPPSPTQPPSSQGSSSSNVVTFASFSASQ